jgi:hypothetical protein
MAGIMQMVANNVTFTYPPYTWYEAFGTTVSNINYTICWSHQNLCLFVDF